MHSLINPRHLRPLPSTSSRRTHPPPPPNSLRLPRHIRLPRTRRCAPRRHAASALAMDDDWMDLSPLPDDLDAVAGDRAHVVLSSSEGEDSDGEAQLTVAEVELPARKERADGAMEDALTVTAHRFATLQGRRRGGIFSTGFYVNLGLFSFLSIFMLLADWCLWRIIRRPLQPFYLSHPFFIAFALSAGAGYIYVPVLRRLNIFQIHQKEDPAHDSKRGTPTIGGLFFIPIGVIVAKATVGLDSVEVYGAVVVTLAFAAIGFLDDMLSLRSHTHGLRGAIKFLLQVSVGICFCFWLDSVNMSSPYNMKFLVPLPMPLGLVYLGKFYHAVAAFSFVSMGNSVDLTDGLDGLVGGVAALALSGMCIAVLPICPDLAVFGASMAGTCAGFLCHNKHKAYVLMGDTGSLALGGALAAMAACTGMYLPLFISSGIFIVEALSAMAQVMFFGVTKCISGSGIRILQTAPLHRHLVLCGLKEPAIVVGSYLISSGLALCAGYFGLISA